MPRRNRSTRRSTALAATWKTASRACPRESGECQLDLFADRTPVQARGRLSAATMRANQLRLWVASMAYVLLCALRRIALAAHPIGQSDLRHDPPQAPQDRRAGAHQRAAHHIRDGFGLPLSTGLRPRSCRVDKRRGALTKQTEPAIIFDTANRNATAVTARTSQRLRTFVATMSACSRRPSNPQPV